MEEDNWVVRAMAIMFNHILDKEVWPERWQSGVVTPLSPETIAPLRCCRLWVKYLVQ